MELKPIEKAMNHLVLGHPFFASILLKRKLVETDKIGTLGVDKRGTIYYNPAFIEKLNINQTIFGLAHEVMHIVGQTFPRQKNRIPDLWNIATDAWINDTLMEAKVGEFIPGCVSIPGSKDKLQEEIYDELLKNANRVPKNALGDEFVPCEGGEPSEEELKGIEEKLKVEIAAAAQAAKVKGKLPQCIERVVDSILHVATPWWDILERWMTALSKQDNSWVRPNRRYAPHGAYLPIRQSEGSLGTMVLGIDTSGSIDDATLATFGGHLNRILEMCRPEKLYLIYCDAAVNSCEVIEGEYEPHKLKGQGGGGTDLTQIFSFAEEHGIEPSVAVILTDGYTPYPESVNYPTIWAMTVKGQTSPVGETIYIGE